jgi:hypothetical protein
MQSVATDFHSSVKGVEQQLNEAASESPPPAVQEPLSTREEPPRQPSLPGLDKI